MQTHIDLNGGLKTFMLAFINDKALSNDETQLIERLQGAGRRLNPRDVRTIMDFATACGYVERCGSQLIFTKLGQDRSNKLKMGDFRLPYRVGGDANGISLGGV